MVVFKMQNVYSVFSLDEFIKKFGTKKLQTIYKKITNKKHFSSFWSEWQEMEGNPINWSIAKNIEELENQCNAYILNIGGGF